jgi:hypothetical protein
VFTLLPLRRIRHGDPQHGLIAFHTVPGQSQIVPAEGQDGPRPGIILLRPSFRGQRGCEHLSTRRTPQLLDCIPDRRQQGIPINADFHSWGQRIQTPLPTDRAYLPHP